MRHRLRKHWKPHTFLDPGRPCCGARLTLRQTTDGDTRCPQERRGVERVGDVEVRALGQAVQTKTDIAIAKLSVSGNVEGSRILAGYDRFGNASNGDAQIGSVTVNGEWAGSSLVAGVLDVNNDGFGGADDIVIPAGNDQIIARISSIIIGGNGGGSFVAQQIDSMTVAGAKVALTTAKNTIVLTNGMNEIIIREVA